MTLRTRPRDREKWSKRFQSSLAARRSTCAHRPAPTGSAALTVDVTGSIISDDDALPETPGDADGTGLADGRGGFQREVFGKDGTGGAGPETTQMELSFPVEDWTVPQLKNLMHTLYSNQHILRRMTQSDALYIDRQLVERLKEAQSPADFEAELADGLAAETLKGCRIRDGKFTFEATFDDRDPTRWQVYGTLLGAMLRHAKAAKRVFLKADADSENEVPRQQPADARLGFPGRSTANCAARIWITLAAMPHSEMRQECARTGEVRSCAGTAGRRRPTGNMSAWMDWILEAARAASTRGVETSAP